MITPTQKTTLEAFLMAVSQLDTSLNDELKQSINKIGEKLANSDDSVIDEIPALVKKDNQLEKLLSIMSKLLKRVLWELKNWNNPLKNLDLYMESLGGKRKQVLENGDNVLSFHKIDEKMFTYYYYVFNSHSLLNKVAANFNESILKAHNLDTNFAAFTYVKNQSSFAKNSQVNKQ